MGGNPIHRAGEEGTAEKAAVPLQEIVGAPAWGWRIMDSPQKRGETAPPEWEGVRIRLEGDYFFAFS
jgi:hypothetical protein